MQALGYAARVVSAIDGAGALVVVNNVHRASKNTKTSDLAQVWFLASGADPLKAAKRGLDRAICGDCPERIATGGRCYVQLKNAPLAVYRAYRRGRYAKLAKLSCVGKKRVRIGAYGDPGVLSPAAWVELLPKLSTGGRPLAYTHQWATRPDLLKFCMASVASKAEGARVKALGGRYFRVVPFGQPLDLGPNEILCPAVSPLGLSCADCGLCFGAPTPAHVAVKDVVLGAHGYLARRPQPKFEA